MMLHSRPSAECIFKLRRLIDVFIFTQDEELVNCDNAKVMYFEEGKIYAEFIDGSELILGDYKNEYRAEQVLEHIASCVGAISTYMMPKE